MQRKSIKYILILTVAIVLIIIAISILSKQFISQKAKIDCQKSCVQTGKNKWLFSGAGRISQNIFSSKEECINACQERFLK
jgi:hypothetical protein